MFTVIFNLGLLIVLAIGSAVLVEAGWVPWTIPCTLALLAIVLGGCIVRRRRGTQGTSASRPHDLPEK